MSLILVDWSAECYLLLHGIVLLLLDHFHFHAVYVFLFPLLLDALHLRELHLDGRWLDFIITGELEDRMSSIALGKGVYFHQW